MAGHAGLVTHGDEGLLVTGLTVVLQERVGFRQVSHGPLRVRLGEDRALPVKGRDRPGEGDQQHGNGQHPGRPPLAEKAGPDGEDTRGLGDAVGGFAGAGDGERDLAGIGAGLEGQAVVAHFQHCAFCRIDVGAGDLFAPKLEFRAIFARDADAATRDPQPGVDRGHRQVGQNNVAIGRPPDGRLIGLDPA